MSVKLIASVISRVMEETIMYVKEEEKANFCASLQKLIGSFKETKGRPKKVKEDAPVGMEDIFNMSMSSMGVMPKQMPSDREECKSMGQEDVLSHKYANALLKEERQKVKEEKELAKQKKEEEKLEKQKVKEAKEAEKKKKEEEKLAKEEEKKVKEVGNILNEMVDKVVEVSEKEEVANILADVAGDEVADEVDEVVCEVVGVPGELFGISISDLGNFEEVDKVLFGEENMSDLEILEINKPLDAKKVKELEKEMLKKKKEEEKLEKEMLKKKKEEEKEMKKKDKSPVDKKDKSPVDKKDKSPVDKKLSLQLPVDDEEVFTPVVVRAEYEVEDLDGILMVHNTKTRKLYYLRHGKCFEECDSKYYLVGKWEDGKCEDGKWGAGKFEMYDEKFLKKKSEEFNVVEFLFKKVNSNLGVKTNLTYYLTNDCKAHDEDGDEVGQYDPYEDAILFKESDGEESEEEYDD